MCDYDVVGIDEGQFVCSSQPRSVKLGADLRYLDALLWCVLFLLLLLALTPLCAWAGSVEQFPDLVSFSDEMANRGKTVIIAALDGTYQRKPFGHVLELIPLAESVIKLSAVCMGCRKRDAAFSHRISAEKQVEVIGGADKYVALCRACHLHFTFVLLRVFFVVALLSLSPLCVLLLRGANRPSRTITEFYTALEPEHKKEAQLRVDELLAGSPRVVSSAPPTPLKHTAAQQARLRP